MGRKFNGTSDFAKYTGAITARPMTMACWFYTGSIAANQCLMFEGDDAFNHEQMMYLTTAQKLAGADRSNTATTTQSYALNAWQHAAVTFGTADTVQIFLNGGNKIANTAGAGTQSNSYFQLGQLSNSGIWWMNGLIAEAGFWNIVLTDAEIADLGQGVPPNRIRRNALLAYWPLRAITSPERDFVFNNFPLTLTGTSLGMHPPMRRALDPLRASAAFAQGVATPAAPGQPELNQRLRMRGAPWFQLPLTTEQPGRFSTAPAPQTLPPENARTGGPRMRGAPWSQPTPVTEGPGFVPKVPTPQTVTTAPGRGKDRPFIERLPDVSDERRLTRITDKLSSFFNSLVSQGVIQQAGAMTWALRSGGFTFARPPTSTDDTLIGATPGAVWVDTAAGKAYICIKNTQGAAQWNGPV